MGTKHEGEPDPADATTDHDAGDPKPVDPEEVDEGGFAGDGGPAAVIYGDDDEAADEHGDRLTRGPDEN